MQFPEILQLTLIYERNVIRGFPKFDDNPKNLHDITNKELGSQNYSILSIIKNQFWSNMLEERPNYLSILSTENGITKLLSFEEVIKEYVAKKCRKKMYYRGVQGS